MIVQVDAKARLNATTILVSMQETGELCDFCLIIGESRVLAHKCILAASCEYFRTSFRFNQSCEPVSSIDLSHLDCNENVVKNIVQSFYTNQLDLEVSTVEAFLRLVDYFICDDLRLCIEKFMEKTLSFHTALLYFQLALQYRLNTTSLFQSAQSYLWFRFHDYFIYQQDALYSSLDVAQAFHQYNLFHFCTPLQVVEFLLGSLKHRLMTKQPQDDKDSPQDSCIETTNEIFEVISSVFNCREKTMIQKWTPYLLKFIKTWMSEIKEIEEYTALQKCYMIDNQIACFEEKLLSQSFGKKETTFSIDDTKMKEHDATPCNEKSSQSSKEDLNRDTSCFNIIKPVSLTTGESHVSGNTFCDHISPLLHPEPQIMSTSDQLELGGSDELEVKKGDDATLSVNLLETFPHSCTEYSKTVIAEENTLKDSEDKKMSEVVVILAPSAEMSSQIHVVEEGSYWPMIKNPQLELALYDVELKTWRRSEKFDFPLPGMMLEKHAWRLAFFNNCIYLFSLAKATGLEYDITKKMWCTLQCRELFYPHSEHSPVRSVIPVAVGCKLIVLSMSREAKIDGTHWIQQDFYEFNTDTKKFTRTATVRCKNMKHEKMDFPITKWTVQGNTLITVKIGTMMYKNISHIHYIHEFDAVTSTVKTHRVFTAMESGIKVFIKGSIVFLLDKEGWCRFFDLTKSECTGHTRYPKQTHSFFSSPYDQENTYPALTRVTCHDGPSRWEVTTSPNNCSVYMQEMVVGEDNSISTKQHPTPPFQYVTALSPGLMSRSLLDRLCQARYEYCEPKNS